MSMRTPPVGVARSSGRRSPGPTHGCAQPFGTGRFRRQLGVVADCVFDPAGDGVVAA
jgi:hypothetical protein